MTIPGVIPLLGRIDGYEQASFVGIVVTILGSTMSWITVEVQPEAAAELDDISAGTTAFTGTDVNFGVITILLAVVALVILGLVQWRYRAPGRKTGLLVMLLGLLSAGVALIGVMLAGSVIGAAGQLDGVSVTPGLGIFVTLLGALMLLSGGMLRLAAGPPTVDDDGSAE